MEMYRDRDAAQGQCSERASERPCGVVESGDRYMDIRTRRGYTDGAVAREHGLTGEVRDDGVTSRGEEYIMACGVVACTHRAASGSAYIHASTHRRWMVCISYTHIRMHTWVYIHTQHTQRRHTTCLFLGNLNLAMTDSGTVASREMTPHTSM